MRTLPTDFSFRLHPQVFAFCFPFSGSSFQRFASCLLLAGSEVDQAPKQIGPIYGDPFRDEVQRLRQFGVPKVTDTTGINA